MRGKYNRLGIGLMFIFLAEAIPSLLSRNAHEIQAIKFYDRHHKLSCSPNSHL